MLSTYCVGPSGTHIYARRCRTAHQHDKMYGLTDFAALKMNSVDCTQNDFLVFSCCKSISTQGEMYLLDSRAIALLNRGSAAYLQFQVRLVAQQL